MLFILIQLQVIVIVDSSAKEEGSEITVTVTRTLESGTEADSVLYFNTTANTATKDDFEFFKKKELKFTKDDKIETVKIKLTQDSKSENPESFYLDLLKQKLMQRMVVGVKFSILKKEKDGIQLTSKIKLMQLMA